MRVACAPRAGQVNPIGGCSPRFASWAPGAVRAGASVLPMPFRSTPAPWPWSLVIIAPQVYALVLAGLGELL